jgi:hypothetical protein
MKVAHILSGGLILAALVLAKPLNAAERPPITLPPLRQDDAGLIVIEAENFDTNTAQGIHRWEFTNSPAGFSGAGTMYALPDEPVAVIDYPDSLTTSPRLDYKVQFTKAGTHYFWFRGSDGGGNSVNAGLNGDSPDTTMNNIDEGCCGTRLVPGGTTFTWVRGIDATVEGRSKFEIPAPGLYTINFWMREDGQIVDKFLITTNINFSPTGAGPAESARIGDPFPPTVSLSSPTANQEFPLGSPITLTASASDSDGTVSKVEFFAGTNKIGEDTSAPFTIQHTPAEAGTFTFTARATDSTELQVTSGAVTAYVIRPATTLPPSRQGDDGLVVIEAENFHTNTAQGIHAWRFDRTPAGYTGAGTMYALPDEPVAVIDYPDSLTTSPRLDYNVQFSKTGTHYIWFRGSDGGGNSFNAGLNGDSPDPTLNNMDEGCCGTRLVPGGTTFTWVGAVDATPEGRSRFEITQAGLHTINLWMREDGQIIDKILVTTDPNFVPTGAGPSESPRVGDPFPPTISLTTPTANQQIAAGTPVTITADARDRDGTVAKVEFFEGTNKIGEATSTPFTFQFNPTQERRYVLSARVTDNSAISTTSSPVTIIYGNPTRVLFTGDNPLTQAGDLAVINRLESQGFLVTAIDDDAVLPTDAAGQALIIVSSTVASGDINTKFTDVAVPLINWEEGIFDDLLMTGDSGAAPDHHGSTANLQRIDILQAGHPLAAGLSGTVQVTTSPQTMSWGVSDANPTNAIVVAQVAGDPTKWAIFAYEKGAPLFDGATPAPERRVGFFFNSGSTTATSDTGFQLFDAAVNWALGRQVAVRPTLTVTREAGQLRIAWSPAGGTLESTTMLGDPNSWSPVANASNPYTTTANEPYRFFRVKR